MAVVLQQQLPVVLAAAVLYRVGGRSTVSSIKNIHAVIGWVSCWTA